MIDFMVSCDVYVLLYCSEGFGCVIVEVMVLGQLVIVINFFGNVDFCDEEMLFLVEGEFVLLCVGDYLFYEG